MRPSRIAALFLLAVVAAASSPAESAWRGSLRTALDAMAEKHWDDRIQAAFGSFTYEYSGLASPFSRWLEDELAAAAAGSARLVLFNRSAAAAMDPAFKDLYGDFFAENQVGALLSGKYFPEGGAVRLRLELTSLRDGNLIGVAEARLPRSELPEGFGVDPSAAVLTRARELANIGSAPSAPGGLAVSVSTGRGAGASYRDGEKLTVHVSVNRDAYVKLYHIGVDGTARLIWPNRYSPGEGRVAAGVPLSLPRSSDLFSFILGAPYGTEFIKAVASLEPFAAVEEANAALEGGARSAISRGLTVASAPAGLAASAAAAGSKAKAAGFAEALASYAIGAAAP